MKKKPTKIPKKKVKPTPSRKPAKPIPKGIAVVKKRKNGRAKGAVAERELAEWLRSQGIPARRGQQFQGGADSPDVVADLPGWHIESKRTEVTNLYGWMAQATKDAAKGAVPVVLHRKNKGRWLAILDAEAWLKIARLARDKEEADLLS